MYSSARLTPGERGIRNVLLTSLAHVDADNGAPTHASAQNNTVNVFFITTLPSKTLLFPLKEPFVQRLHSTIIYFQIAIIFKKVSKSSYVVIFFA